MQMEGQEDEEREEEEEDTKSMKQWVMLKKGRKGDRFPFMHWKAAFKRR